MSNEVASLVAAFTLVGELTRLDWDSDSHQGTVVRLADEATVGSFSVEQMAEPAALFVETLLIEPEHRGYGCGSDAARLLRSYAERGPWQLVRAWAPPHLGLAVYFWSRMGLRPLHGEGPNGGIWFERDTS